jgi:cyclase
MDLQNIELFSANLSAPLIASSGAGNIKDFAGALRVGASAVAAGAIFQFTEITPGEVRESLRELGFSVRNQ